MTIPIGFSKDEKINIIIGFHREMGADQLFWEHLLCSSDCELQPDSRIRLGTEGSNTLFGDKVYSKKTKKHKIYKEKGYRNYLFKRVTGLSVTHLLVSRILPIFHER